MSPIVQIWAHHDTICSPDMKVLFMRGDLLIEDSATPAQSHCHRQQTFFFRMLCGNAKSLTLSHALSELNTKSRHWWCSSKCERRVFTIAIASVAMLIIMIAFMRTRRENRCEKGVTSSTVRDTSSVTRDAMICSADASTPSRPVYD